MERKKKWTKHKSCSVFATAEKRHAEVFSLCTNLCVEMWLKSWNTGTYAAHCKKKTKMHLGLRFFSVLWSSAKFISALFQYNYAECAITEHTQHKDGVQRRQHSALKDSRHAPVPIRHFIQKNKLWQKPLNTNWAQNKAIFVFNLIQFTVNCLPQTVVMHVCVTLLFDSAKKLPSLAQSDFAACWKPLYTCSQSVLDWDKLLPNRKLLQSIYDQKL